VLSGQDSDFLTCLDVAQRELHGEPIHLRFRQRVSSAELYRVLRRNHEEQIRQVAALAVHAHLVLSHRFQQGRLRPRRGAVDFVREHDVRENRPLVEVELLVPLAEH